MRYRFVNLLVVLTMLLSFLPQPARPVTAVAPATTAHALLQAVATVAITATGFDPAQVTIQPGDTVEWINQTAQVQRIIGGTPYFIYLPLVLRNQGSMKLTGTAPSAAQATNWGSGDIAPGERFTHTFSTMGDYPYYLGGAVDITGRIIVQGQPQPDFVLMITPVTRSVAPGDAVTYAVVLTATNGFTAPVTLSVSDLPTGATAQWSATQVTPTGNAVLTVTTTTDTPAGDHLLTVNGSGGGKSHQAQATLQVTGGCVAVTEAFFVSDGPVELGQPMHFTATVTPVNATGPLTYTWDFGAGPTAGDFMMVAYTFATTGTHPVTLTIANGCGSATFTDTVSVVDVGVCVPISGVDFTSDSPVDVGQAMHFAASATPAGATRPLTYTWNFGGAGVQGGTPVQPTYTYSAPGTYMAALTGTNPCGGPLLATHPVTVNALSAGVDLVVDAIQVSPENPTATQPVTVSVTIRNQGSIAASGTFYTYLYVDPATPPVSGQLGDYVWAKNSLAPGASETLVYNYGGFNTPGDHALWAQVDTFGSVAESDETNNIAGPMTVTAQTALADLIVQNIATDPLTPTLNQPCTLTVQVKNQGIANITDTFQVNAYIDPALPPAPGEAGGHTWQQVGLAIGASAILTREIIFTEGGSHTLYTQVDTGQVISESNEANNISGPHILSVHTPMPDLVVQTIATDPTTPTIGYGFILQVGIKNQGDNNTSETFRVDWYRNPGAVPISTTLGNGYWEQNGLRAGEVVTLTTLVTVTVPGDHTFYAQVDTASGGIGAVAERDEANNITGPVIVTADVPKPDLMVVRITTDPEFPRVNQAATLQVVVKNRGYLATGSSFRVDWYRDPLEAPIPGETGDGYWMVPSLAVGQVTTLTTSVVLTQPLTYPFYAQVDTLNTNQETDESNNIYGPDGVAAMDEVAVSDLCTINGGYIYENLILTSAHSPYLIIDCDVYIGDGNVLMLEPGVVVKLQYHSLNIGTDGQLIAQGTVAQPVVFTSYQDDTYAGDTNGDGEATLPYAGEWYGISGRVNSHIDLQYTTVRYGGGYGSIYAPGDLTLRDSVVEWAGEDGIYIQPTSEQPPDILIERSTIQDNGGVGINIFGYNNQPGSLVIRDNVIARHSACDYYCYGWGIALTGVAAFEIVNNTLEDNGGNDTYYLIHSGGIAVADVLGNSGVISGNLIMRDSSGGYADVGIEVAYGTPQLINNIVQGYAMAVGISGGYPQFVPTYNGNDFSDVQYQTVGVWGDITEGTWTNFSGYNHFIGGDAYLSAGQTFTVPAGTVVKFYNGSLDLRTSATLHSSGTMAQPVVFTSIRDDSYGGDTNNDGMATLPAPTDWGEIRGDENSHIEFYHTIVRYGGASLYTYDNASIRVYGDLTLQDSVVEWSGEDGIIIEPASGYTPDILIERSTIQDNDGVGINIYGYDDQPESLVIRDNVIARQSYWDYYGFGWGIALGGVTAFEIVNNRLEDNGGNNADYEVKLSGGIVVADAFGSSGVISGNLITRDSSSGYADVGIEVANSTPQLINNIVRGYAMAVGISDGYPQYVPTYSGNDFSDVRYQTVGVWGDLTEGTWTNFAGYNHFVAERVYLSSGQTFTIPAGAVVKFPSYYGSLELQTGATLNSLGTAAQPAVFTSIRDDSYGGDTNSDGATTLPYAGDWAYIYGGITSRINFQHTIVRYGGGGEYTAASIEATGSITVQDSVVEWSENGGLYIAPADLPVGYAPPDVVIERSTMQNNTYSGLSIYTDNDHPLGDFTCHNNNIASNGYGLSYTHSDSRRLDATNNWWGHDSGPTHPSNPGGMGDAVSDDVDFDPWTGKAAWIAYQNLVRMQQVVAAARPADPLRNTEPAEPGVPYIESVQSEHNFFVFIGGVEQFTVRVDWNGAESGQGTPGIVKFKTKNRTYAEAGDETGAQHNLYTEDFKAGMNKVEVIAMLLDGTESKPFTVDVFRFAAPQWMWKLEFNEAKIEVVRHPDYSEAKMSLAFPPDPFEIAVGSVTGVPFFEESKPPDPAKLGVELTIRSDRKGSFKTSLEDLKFSVAGVEAEFTPFIESELDFDHEWRVGVAGYMGADTKVKIEGPKLSLVRTGAQGIPLDYLVDVYLQSIVEITNKFKAGFELRPEADSVTWPSLEGGSGVKLEVILAGEILKGLAKVEGYGGGSAEATLQFPPDPDYLKEFKGSLFLGVRYEAFGFLKGTAWEKTWEYSYWPVAKRQPLSPALDDLNSTSVTLLEWPIEDWHIEPQDYGTRQLYANFDDGSMSLTASHRPATPSGSTITPLVTNLYANANPALVLHNDQALLLWTHDDISLPESQSKEILSSWWDGTTWSIPVSVTTDTMSEFNPQVVMLNDTQAMAVWERINDPAVPMTATLDMTLTNKIELVYATFDFNTHTWTSPSLLTDNAIFDHVPQLASNGSGQVMVVWRSNVDGELLGSPEHPDSLNYAVWDNAAWTTGVITEVIDDLLTYSVAYADATNAIVVLNRDQDGDQTTHADIELFAIEWDDASWGTLTQITDNSVADENPTVLYTVTGERRLVWMQDTRLAVLYDDWTAAPTLTDIEGGGLGMLNFAVALDDKDNLMLLWRAHSDAGQDLYHALYDAEAATWSMRTQLTANAAVERELAVAFDPNGQLIVAYLQDNLIETDMVISPTLTITGVTQYDSTDLYLLHYTPDTDLTVSDLALPQSSENPGPGDSVNITVTVQNAGDWAAVSPIVALYDGNPGTGGTLIARRTIAGALVGGATAQVNIPWTVPAIPVQPHTLYAVIDPDGVITESLETNNTLTLTTVTPDVAVASVRTYYYDQHNVVPVAVIANNGPVTATNVLVEFRADAITGTIQHSAVITELAPSGLQAITTTWNITGWTSSDYTYYAVVDSADTIFEVNEEDNWDYFPVKVWPDLVIYSGDVQASLTESGGPVTVTVRNWGTADAANTPVVLYEGPVITPSATALYTWTVASLLVDSDGDVQLVTTLDHRANRLFAIADPQHVITEVEEYNNVALLTQPISVTFRYHDLEGVIPTTATVTLQGDWMSEPIVLTDAGGVYSATVSTGETPLNYRYAVDDNLALLNTYTRTVTPTVAIVYNDYRLVTPDNARLVGPAILNGVVGVPTALITAHVTLAEVTSLPNTTFVAEVGYGTSTTFTTWTWTPLTYFGDLSIATISPASLPRP